MASGRHHVTEPNEREAPTTMPSSSLALPTLLLTLGFGSWLTVPGRHVRRALLDVMSVMGGLGPVFTGMLAPPCHGGWSSSCLVVVVSCCSIVSDVFSSAWCGGVVVWVRVFGRGCTPSVPPTYERRRAQTCRSPQNIGPQRGTLVHGHHYLHRVLVPCRGLAPGLRPRPHTLRPAPAVPGLPRACPTRQIVLLRALPGPRQEGSGPTPVLRVRCTHEPQEHVLLVAVLERPPPPSVGERGPHLRGLRDATHVRKAQEQVLHLGVLQRQDQAQVGQPRIALGR